MDVLGILVSWRDLAGIDHVGLAATEGLAVGPEISVSPEGKDFGWVDGTFGIVSAGWSSLKWVGTGTAATSVGAGGAVKDEFSSEDWTSNGEGFVARESVRVMIVGTGIDLVIAIIFIEDYPGIDVGDVAGDIDFLGKDEKCSTGKCSRGRTARIDYLTRDNNCKYRSYY